MRPARSFFAGMRLAHVEGKEGGRKVMKSIHKLSPLALVILLFGFTPELPLSFLSSEEQSEKDIRSWMIVLPKSMDAEPEVYRIGPLEEGESRQFITSEGDEIMVERESSGRTIELNGEEIHTHTHHGAFNITTHVGGENKIISLHKSHVVSSSEHEEETLAHAEKVEGGSGHHMIVSIDEDDTRPGIRINALSSAGESPQIIIVDRVHIEKEK
jgi:hypothetical protein